MYTILLVEDAKEYHLVVKQVLIQHNVISVFSVDEALAYLSHNNVHLILLDLSLPQKSGYSLLTEMQKMENATPVICLTGQSSVNAKIEAFKLGADDYIIKPFDALEFAARIESKLFKSQRNGDLILKIGQIEIDQRTHSVRGMKSDGEALDIDLTNTEYKLLICLAKRPEQVFSRSQLLDSVWGNNTEVVERVVDVHIYGLRKKIKPYLDSIKSVPGAGYKLTRKSLKHS